MGVVIVLGCHFSFTFVWSWIISTLDLHNNEWTYRGQKSLEIYRTKNWPNEMSKKQIVTDEILIKELCITFPYGW